MQQQQQIVTPQQSLVSLSVGRARECDERSSRSPSVSTANGGLDSRYYTQISVPRIRPAVSRSSASTLSQQTHLSNANTLPNASLRMNVTARSTSASIDPTDSNRSCPARQTPIGTGSSSSAHCARYVPVNGYKPGVKGSATPVSNSLGAFTVQEKGDTKQTSSTRCMMSSGMVTGTSGASSDGSVILPQSSVSTSHPVTTNSTPTSTPNVSASHAGPSPRPSILRKVRDPSSAAGSAVRRLVMSDAPSSRPASCASNFSSSTLLPDDASCSTKCASVGGEVRALSATPLCNYEPRSGQLNEANARYVHSAFTENAPAAFSRVGDSPQRASELDTPRKRLRKQQFDSSQAPDKIKMEVSVHVDANKIDYQKEEISLWRLAPAGQVIENSPSLHTKNVEKTKKRRGRPRADSQLTNELPVSSLGSSASAMVIGAPPKSKKPRKSQAGLGTSEANAARGGFVTDEGGGFEARYADGANVSSEMPKRRLHPKVPRSSKGKKAVRPTSETAEAETAAKTLSSFFQEVQRKKNEVSVSSTQEKPRLCEPAEDNEGNRDETAYVEVDCPMEAEDACSLSSDISDVSLDFAPPGEKARSTPTVASNGGMSKATLIDNQLDTETRPLYKPRPRLLSSYKMPTNTKISHIERPECAKAVLEKVRMLKAAKNSLKAMQRSARERNAMRRLQLKREFLSRSYETASRNNAAPHLVDGACVQKMNNVSTSELCASTIAFYKTLSRICPMRSVGRDTREGSSLRRERGRTPPSLCLSSLPNSAVPTPVYAHSECGASREDTMSPCVASCRALFKAASAQQSGDSELTAVVEVLAAIIDQVVGWTGGDEGRCEGISGKVKKKKRRRRTMRSIYIDDSRLVNSAALRLDDAACKEWRSQTKEFECETSEPKIKMEGSRKNDCDKMLALDGEYEEDLLEEQLRELKIAIKDLSRKDYTSHSFTSDPATIFNATHERLLRMERNELENEANTMQLMLDFLQVTNKEAYDQLIDDIEKDYDSDDDQSTREQKRRRRIVAYSVRVPRANPSLPKRDLYNANRSTNFHPTTANINQLFGFGSSYYRGHLSANNPKAYVYLDRKGNRVKERVDVHRFREYEFVPDSEVDDMRLNLNADLMRDEYENELGLMLTQYRFDDPENDFGLMDNERRRAGGSLPCDLGAVNIRERKHREVRRRVSNAASSSEVQTVEEEKEDAMDEQLSTASRCAPQEMTGSKDAKVAQMSPMNVKEEEDDDVEVIGEKMVGVDVELLGVKREPMEETSLRDEPEITDEAASSEKDQGQHESCATAALSQTERLQMARRANNIREMFATLLHTLRVNSYLASVATEVFSDHAREILFDSAQSSVGSGDTSKSPSSSCTDVAGPSKEQRC
ncbi:hypothetical protein Tcan_12806 [Toxocara canis]|uniref:Uncharacterized protein n=1 Tax=Toxocara canis TaxID=6265 RepID=A0A0B2UN09_TOXCA|nr:hypothetical protein Tcan_12806 [Toxocara canis]